MRWANAGHPPGMLRLGGDVVELPPTGPAIGPFPGRWRTELATIPPGGELILYTDGLTEARGPTGFYGTGRLMTTVAHGPAEAAELVDRLLEEALGHARGRLADDATAVVVPRTSPPPPLA